MTLQSQLRAYLAKYPNDWHSKSQLCRQEWRDSKGHLASPENIGRRLRELEEDGQIAAKDEKGHAFYHHIPRDWQPSYIPKHQRVNANTYWREPLLSR